MPNRWDHAAEIRKNQIENNLDITFSKVFVPYYISFVKNFKPKSLLEIGAGTGHLALNLYEYCDNYHAIEPSNGMFNIAQKTLINKTVNLEKCSIEDMNVDYMKFDLIISHMCAHVIKNIDVFYNKIANLLNINGKWMFSIPHPCFYNDYKKIFNSDYRYIFEMYTEFGLTITNDNKVIEKIPYYHRPLQFYINKLFANDLILEYINEVYPDENIQKLYGGDWKYPRYITFIGARPWRPHRPTISV